MLFRSARAVATRRTLTIESVRDLGALDPEAIARVREDAWPLVRDADELYDALMVMGIVSAEEGRAWTAQFDELVRAGRALESVDAEERRLWVAIEQWPLVRAALPDLRPDVTPAIDSDHRGWTEEAADIALVRGRLEVSGPVTVPNLSHHIGIPQSRVDRALLALEHEGFVLRGRFSPGIDETEWCARRLLARIHRLTLDRLRREIEPVSVERFVDFLLRWQRMLPGTHGRGRDGVLAVITQLQGFEIPAAAWEGAVLPARIESYDPRWLDELCLSGEVVWGRIAPPVVGPEAQSAGRIRSATRYVPIALMARGDLPWLRWRHEEKAEPPPLSTRARLALDALVGRGASFFADLAGTTHLLPAELHDALRELVAAGLVTQDGFGAVRSLVSPIRGHRRRRHRPLAAPRSQGRWTTLSSPSAAPEDTIDGWARDRKSTRLNSSHIQKSRMPSSA